MENGQNRTEKPVGTLMSSGRFVPMVDNLNLMDLERLHQAFGEFIVYQKQSVSLQVPQTEQQKEAFEINS